MVTVDWCEYWSISWRLHIKVTGFEPMALCTQNRCADQTALHLARGVDEPTDEQQNKLGRIIWSYFWLITILVVVVVLGLWLMKRGPFRTTFLSGNTTQGSLWSKCGLTETRISIVWKENNIWNDTNSIDSSRRRRLGFFVLLSTRILILTLLLIPVLN